MIPSPLTPVSSLGIEDQGRYSGRSLGLDREGELHDSWSCRRSWWPRPGRCTYRRARGPTGMLKLPVEPLVVVPTADPLMTPLTTEKSDTVTPGSVVPIRCQRGDVGDVQALPREVRRVGRVVERVEHQGRGRGRLWEPEAGRLEIDRDRLHVPRGPRQVGGIDSDGLDPARRERGRIDLRPRTCPTHWSRWPRSAVAGLLGS